MGEETYQPTPQLRWVECDGERVLQQLWESMIPHDLMDMLMTGKVPEIPSEWRDVPLVEENEQA